MKIIIACDHGGYELKEVLVSHLIQRGYDVSDLGTHSSESVDFPNYADAVCKRVKDTSVKGILICGTGIGMSIAANKHKGIRAALVSDTYSARMTRAHNDSNVLCLGGRVIGNGLALDIVDLWLETDFLGGKYQKRLDLMEVNHE